MNRKEWEARRVQAYKLLQELGDHDHSWWLNALVEVVAKLHEYGTHGDSYYTEPEFYLRQWTSDGGPTAKDDPGILNRMRPWQIRVFLRLKEEWEAWCANEREELTPDVMRPGRILQDHKWGTMWKDGCPYPEGRGAKFEEEK